MLRKLAQNFRKYWATAIGLVGGLLILPLPTHAFVLNWLVYGISWLLNMIAGAALAIQTWFIGFLLQINTQIINSPAVSLGFPIVLNFTNLLFIFALIIIAVATIVRYDGYGWKQTLWKLVVVAVAINFGLVIASSVLGFADTLSNYFVNSIVPDTTQNKWGVFGGTVGAAFKPQNLAWLDVGQTQLLENSSGGGATDSLLSALPVVGPGISLIRRLGSLGTGQFIGAELLQPIAALLFTVFFLIFINIILFVLATLLVYRYMTLVFLLIFLPLAWASVIFNRTKGNFSNWWTKFLGQAFFAPIVIFTLWLAIKTSELISADPKKWLDTATFSNKDLNPTWGGVDQFFTGLFGPTIAQSLQLIVILGMMGGGITVASKIGVKGAEAADAYMKSVRGTAQSWAKTGFRRYARQPVTGALARSERMQTWQTQSGIRGLAGRYTVRTGFKDQQQAIGESKDKLKGLTADQIAEMINKGAIKGDVNMLGALDFAKDGKALDKINVLNDERLMDKAFFDKYRRGDLYGSLLKETGFDVVNGISEAAKGNKKLLAEFASTGEGLEKLAGTFKKFQKMLKDPALKNMVGFQKEGESTVEAKARWETQKMHLLRAVGENLTTSNARDFIKKLGGKENEKDWIDAANNFKDPINPDDPNSEKNLGEVIRKNNEKLHEYLKNNPNARQMHMDEFFGVKKDDEAQNPNTSPANTTPNNNTTPPGAQSSTNSATPNNMQPAAEEDDES